MRRTFTYFLLLAAAAAAAFPARPAAAQIAALHLGPDKLPSGAAAKGEWIDVQSWKWGETVPTSPGQSPAHELHQAADVGSLTVVAKMDPASCKLGARYSGARLRTGYLDYVLEDAMVSCCTTGGSSGGEPPLETMSLNYGKIAKEYKAQDDKTTKTPPKWDVPKNRPE